jgi:hypothetical protein
VYFGTYNGRVLCVDATGTWGSTTRKWEYNTLSGNMGILGSPAVGHNKVYVGAVNSNLYCLDAFGSGSTTTKYWDKQLTPVGQYGIYSSPALTEDYVYVGTTGNGFHCRDRLNGDNEWSVTYPPASGLSYGMSISPAIFKDKVIITADNGNLYFFEADVNAPKVVSINPVNDETDVDIATNITVTFNEKIVESTLTASTLTLVNSSSNPVTGTITYNMNPGVFKAYFTPSTQLEKEETYTFTVTTDIKDVGANTLDGNGNGIAEGVGVDEYTIKFTTLFHGRPYISELTKLYLEEDEPYKLDISSSISDADTPSQNLIITQNSTYCTLDGFELNLLYPNGILYDLINISVSDGLFSFSRELEVEILPVNDLPVIAEIEPLLLDEDISYILDMKLYVTDVDTSYDDLSLIDYSKYTEIDGMTINFTYPEGVTSDNVKINVMDGGDFSSTDVKVTIRPVNDPPAIKPIPDRYVEEDVESSFTVFSYISDEDTPKEDLKIIVDSPYVDVNGFELIFLYPDTVQTDYLNVEVTDGELYCNTTLKVIVDPVNDPPEIEAIISPVDGFTYEYNTSLDFEALVSDPDLKFGDTLEFVWHDDKTGQFANTQNATGIVLPPGHHTIKFTVTDYSGSSTTATITVDINAKPETQKPDEPDPDTTTDPGSKEATTDNSMALILAAIVVVIIILFVVFMMIRQKKKKDEQKAKVAQEQAALAAQLQQVPYDAQMQMQQPYPQFPPQPQYPDQYPMQQLPQDQYQYPEQLPPQDYYQGYPQYPQTPDQAQYYDQSQQVAQQPFDQQQFQGPGVEQVPQLPPLMEMPAEGELPVTKPVQPQDEGTSAEPQDGQSTPEETNNSKPENENESE